MKSLKEKELHEINISGEGEYGKCIEFDCFTSDSVKEHMLDLELWYTMCQNWDDDNSYYLIDKYKKYFIDKYNLDIETHCFLDGLRQIIGDFKE